MILGVDTSSARGSVALVDKNGVIDEMTSETPASFSRTLLDMIEAILSKQNLDIHSFGDGAVRGVAVTTGPGSFTGIRIGISTVQGIALSTNVPVYGISTLEAMARVSDFNNAATILIDAGKGNAYYADFGVAGGKLERKSPDGFTTIAELAGRDEKRSFFCDKGDATRIAPHLAGECAALKNSAAAGAAFRAAELAASGAGGEVALLASNYVQKSYAERSLNHFQEG